eukprot:CAMPEP_0172158494 /NCGR_PEP_ID=MMETSP1050-20130122/4405_1 /TAXON_ID=233186 /ORGANISM="Cryptomonas curvata, Strain CCAP979/52" /LENGTH=60 /DNA_ID=CAMNT_0012827895 /DNA_START=15 /DNA_END=197 /DNA_ORIENTATION=-
MFFNRQRTTKLILGGNSVRAQKAFALDYCASAFVTEGEVKYCVAKLFSNNVKLEKEWNDL